MKKIFTVILALSLLGTTLKGHAQLAIDSTNIDLYHIGANFQKKQELDSATFFFKRALYGFKKDKKDKLATNCLFTISKNYNTLQNPDSTVVYAQQFLVSVDSNEVVRKSYKKKYLSDIQYFLSKSS